MIELLQAFYDLQLGEYMFLNYDFFSCLVCFPQTNGPDSIYGLQLGEHMFLNYDLFLSVFHRQMAQTASSHQCGTKRKIYCTYAWDRPSKLTKRWKSMPSLMYPVLHVHDESHGCSRRGNSTMLSLSPILMVKHCSSCCSDACLLFVAIISTEYMI